MKKRLLATVLAAGLVLSMTACGSSQTQSTAAAETTKAAASSEAATTKGSEAAGTEAAASTWKPTTTVSIVVPAGAGGNTDLSARVFAEYAKRMTGADFIVVNANGAAGSVAANQVRSAAADGHTFLYGHNLVNVANIAGVTDYNYTAFKLGPTFALDPAQQFYANPGEI
ncbi:tripartite tricarboxylate transporter substrate-binding protein [Lacrimispora xylanisolvens]|uniref:tripartite tricarboxylate transporter substrate-binding protein n=1 Tax=Lacrimispora xylanisolvens TaxID=384636 RepID=UPI0024029EF2